MGQYDDLTVSDLHSMEPYQFEYFVADLWRRRGYSAEVTQGSADGGIDVIADGNGERIGIQAKRYAQGNPVGVKTVRETTGVGNRPEFDQVAIATSGDFTSGAYKEANQQGVKLYDGERLLKMNRSATGATQAFSSGLPTTPVGTAGGLLVGALTTDPEEFGTMIVNLIQLALMLAVGYVVLDALLTNIFDFPLPWGI